MFRKLNRLIFPLTLVLILVLLSLMLLYYNFYSSLMDDVGGGATQEKEKPLLKVSNFNLIGTDSIHYDEKKLLLNNENKKIIFFGFTFCPDVCPSTLYHLSSFNVDIQEMANQPIYFVTVDPQRDTVEVLSSYLKNFGNNIIGLTGIDKEIENILKIFYVYRKKIPQEETYTYDHTSSVFLIDEENHIIDTIYYNEPVELTQEKLRNFLSDSIY